MEKIHYCSVTKIELKKFSASGGIAVNEIINPSVSVWLTFA
jgi:hypothetical protein